VQVATKEISTPTRVNVIARHPTKSALIATVAFGLIMVKMDTWIGKKISSLTWF